MLGNIKYKILSAFRELLVYHSSSLVFRAELMTLMIFSEGKIAECEEHLIEEISTEIYHDDGGRAKILSETIHEFHTKIVTKNGLNYDDLIIKLTKDIKREPRFVEKINIKLLDRFRACHTKEEDEIFHDRIIEFLRDLKEEYGGV